MCDIEQTLSQDLQNMAMRQRCGRRTDELHLLTRKCMKTNVLKSPLRMALLVSALLVAGAAQAAAGFIVSAAQQTKIKAGMTRDEVRAVLGRPAHNVKYKAEPGRTWTYGIQGSEDKVFDVDFSAAGVVMTTSQRQEQME
jgi:outer membrane protein assembly factor BamE (lipoprotein component of BamABCDE complex)